MWFFRLPPLVYLVLAPLGIALAVFFYIDDRQSEADKAAARAGKPPALVQIEKFDPARNIGVGKEVNVAGQVDFNQAMELTRSKRGVERERWVMAPVYATTATKPEGPAIGLMIQRGAISDAQIEAMVAAEGNFGPILRLNGIAIDRSAEGKAVDEMSGRVSLSPNAVLIDPFEAGRDAGLAPSTSGRDVALGTLIIALLIGAFGAFRFLSARNKDDLPDAEPEPTV